MGSSAACKNDPNTVKQQARKIILQGPRCRETRFPRNGQAQVSPTSSPRGMSVEQHITATSIHTITTTIVRTPQTVDGRWWSSLSVPCHGLVPSSPRCAALRTKSHPPCHCTFTASQTGDGDSVDSAAARPRGQQSASSTLSWSSGPQRVRPSAACGTVAPITSEHACFSVAPPSSISLDLQGTSRSLTGVMGGLEASDLPMASSLLSHCLPAPTVARCRDCP